MAGFHRVGGFRPDQDARQTGLHPARECYRNIPIDNSPDCGQHSNALLKAFNREETMISISRNLRPTPPRIIAAMLVSLILPCLANAQSAFVRVNQVGYVSGASKRAYLM